MITSSSPAPIIVGMNARLFPSNWRPATEEIAFARALGFAALQLPGQEHGLDAARLGAPFEVVADALLEAEIEPVMEIIVRLDAAGRTAGGLTPLDVLRLNLPAITALRCARVHLHLAPLHRMERAALRALEAGVAPQFAHGAELAGEHGFRFGFEHNEPWIPLFAEPAACAALLEATPGLGFVWDCNHAAPEQVDGYLALTPRMQMLHIADTPLPEVNHHLPLGLGSIDFDAYLDAVLARGFAGPAILEIGGLPHSGGYGRDTDAALADSLARLRRVISHQSSVISRKTDDDHRRTAGDHHQWLAPAPCPVTPDP
jgi:sugar phosphate isomerase/epimerase